MAYAQERVELVRGLRERAKERALGDLLRLDGRTLRFHLGTSLADLKVPVGIEPALLAAFQRAVRDLFFLLCQRHRAHLKPAEYDALLLLDGFDPQRSRPLSFVPPASVSSDGVRRAFFEAPQLHPALDAGVIAGWIASRCPGRAFVGAVNALLRRALLESAQSEAGEPTAYLAVLTLRVLAAQVPALLRTAPIAQPMGRVIQGAVAAGLLVALRLAVREAGVAGTPWGPWVDAANTPIVWLGGMKQLPGSGLQAYGVAFTEPPAEIDDLARKLAAGARLEDLSLQVITSLRQDELARTRAERTIALAVLRHHVLELVRWAEAAREPLVTLEGMTLAQLLQHPTALAKLLAASDRRKDAAARLKEAARAVSNPVADDHLQVLLRCARGWKEEAPGAWLGADVAQQGYAEAVVALAADAALERMVAAAQQSLSVRTGLESEGGIADEHEQGKLYLMAFDERPILHARRGTPQMAHLFCDVKDFTRRTAFLKETVVADFLAREFYTPILDAAGRHYRGAGHLGDRGGIYLNNLLGDAVSFSGDVNALVELAKDVRLALESYAKRLESEATRDGVSKVAAAIEERYTARRRQLEEQLRESEAAGKEPGQAAVAAVRGQALRQELDRLEEERESELALASGEKLEAGLFLSYGAAPEVATFEDAVFGAIRVSIAEKINESARGTARNGAVRARVDALVERAKKSRANPSVFCPFTVLIGQALSVPVPPEAELAVRAALAKSDGPAAARALQKSVESFLARLAEEGYRPQHGDIYNGGAAISAEALDAYVEARAEDFFFLRRTISIDDLHPSLRDRFVFPMHELVCVGSVGEASRTLEELYVFVGRALFKGLEKTGGLGVFEIIPPRSAFFALLAEHHVPQWIREHDQAGGEGERPSTLTQKFGVR